MSEISKRLERSTAALASQVIHKNSGGDRVGSLGPDPSLSGSVGGCTDSPISSEAMLLYKA